MNYHLFYALSPSLSMYQWDVDEDYVRRITEAYLRGKETVIIKGAPVIVGKVDLQIYEVKKIEGASGIIFDSISKVSAAKEQFSKEYFERNFTNVTDKFLRGMSYGDLIEDYFNIFINDGDNKPIIQVLNKNQVQEFLTEWEEGKNPIWVSGREIELKKPKSLKIFDIKFEHLSKNTGEIKEFFRKYVKSVHSGKWSVDVLSHFGSDVSSNWKINAYGILSKPVKVIPNTVFNWDIIHPVIKTVALQRFQSNQFADSVEASFKEINKIIKTEYSRIKSFEKDGDKLMKEVFSLENGAFRLADTTSEEGRNIQLGYMEIFAGAMKGIRNPKAHSNQNITEIDAWEKIVLASHLMKMWDKRTGENKKSL